MTTTEKFQAPNPKYQTSTKFQIPNSKQIPMTEAPSTKQRFDLEERTLEFTQRVIQLCKTVQATPVTRELISQLVRASSSIGANYREANEALSKKDFGYRVRIARKEAKETTRYVKARWKKLVRDFEYWSNIKI